MVDPDIHHLAPMLGQMGLEGGGGKKTPGTRQGFYQLPGRVELAFAIQEQLLPCFGAWVWR